MWGNPCSSCPTPAALSAGSETSWKSCPHVCGLAGVSHNYGRATLTAHFYPHPNHLQPGGGTKPTARFQFLGKALEGGTQRIKRTRGGSWEQAAAMKGMGKGMEEANKTVPVNPAGLRQETAPSVHPEGRQPWQQGLQAQGIQAVPDLLL